MRVTSRGGGTVYLLPLQLTRRLKNPTNFKDESYLDLHQLVRLQPLILSWAGTVGIAVQRRIEAKHQLERYQIIPTC